MNRLRCAAILLVCVLRAAGLAYELDTHEKLAREAVAGATITRDADVMGRLGLLAPTDESQKFPSVDDKPRTITKLIEVGAQLEDTADDPVLPHIGDRSPRPRHHFFDPYYAGRGLTVGGYEAGYPSPDFALEDSGQDIQEASYADARSAFYQALTAAAAGDRAAAWGRTFTTLGQVIHHLHDMAQPQHTRNDPHVGVSGLGETTAYEEFVEETYPVWPDEPAGAAPWFPTPRGFWTNGAGVWGPGIAQYFSRNFLSIGTNFFLGPDGAILPRDNPADVLPAGT